MSRKELAENIIVLLKEKPNDLSKITDILFGIFLTVTKEKLAQIIEVLKSEEILP
ncbi:hypothetical protein MUP35_04395 [Patescibacteria group bacterium]|nr:hypothetical protein [Patescibacteria group bacterium]